MKNRDFLASLAVLATTIATDAAANIPESLTPKTGSPIADNLSAQLPTSPKDPFVLTRTGGPNGNNVAWHSSHASHASHASHFSSR